MTMPATVRPLFVAAYLLVAASLPTLLQSPCFAQAPPAWAPAYSGASYSGGTVNDGAGTRSYTDASQYNGIGNEYGGNAFGGSPASCSGDITVSVPYSSTNVALPQSVIVTLNTAAGWGGGQGTTGSCADPYATSGPSISTPSNPGQGYSTTTYSAPAGADPLKITVSGLSSSSTFTQTNPPMSSGLHSAVVDCGVAVNPVYIVPGGAAIDSDNKFRILVGQQFTPTLFVPGCTVTKSAWTVTGTVFQSWGAPAGAGSPSTYSSGPGSLTTANPSWYWNDADDKTTEMVTCTATATAPDGKTQLPVSATINIIVYRPNWTAMCYPGNEQVSVFGAANAQDNTPNDNWLYAGPRSGFAGGMNWEFTLAPPTGTSFSSGYLQLIQLMEYHNNNYTDSAGNNHTCTYDTETSFQLDNQNPYDSYNNPGATQPYQDNDSPGEDLSLVNAYAMVLDETFHDYLMFTPPGSNQAIPLATYTWQPSGKAAIPSSHTWIGYTNNSAGTIAGSGSFTKSNSFPTWTKVVGGNTNKWN